MPLRDAARDYAACVLTLILPVYACLGLRFYVRRSRKHIGPDDWCMVPGAFFFAGLTVTSLIGAWNGIGTHEWNLAEDETPRAAMWLTIGSLWFFATVLCTKLAIAFMLCRVARGRHNYIHALHACMALFTVTILAGCMYLILHCRPFAYNWDKGITGGACRHPNNVKVIYYTITSTDIATNWFCALLPIPLLWNVQMDLRHKISVVACMSLGFFASIAALIRLRYIPGLQAEADFLYNAVFCCIWACRRLHFPMTDQAVIFSDAEVGIGICAGSIATLRPLLENRLKRKFLSQSSQRITRVSVTEPRSRHQSTSKTFRHASVAPMSYANVEVGTGYNGGSIGGATLTDGNNGPRNEPCSGGIMVSYDVEVAHGDVESRSLETRKASEPGW